MECRPFVRFQAWRIHSSDVYRERLQQVLETLTLADGSQPWDKRFWEIMSLVDAWEWDDTPPELKPTKRARTGDESTAIHNLPGMSPPPSKEATSLDNDIVQVAATPGPVCDATISPSLAPTEVLPTRSSASSSSNPLDIVAANKAAALERRRLKQEAAARAEHELRVFEAMQWHF
jgi:hypothetical protein